MKKKNPTMEDIAKELNISKYAVSLALANKKGVSEETRLKVIQMANKIGYKNNRMRNRGTDTIGVVVSQKAFKDPYFFSIILNDIEKEARSRGYAVNIISIDRNYADKESISDFILNNAIQGIIIVSNIGDDIIAKINDCIPVVVVDHYIRDLDVDCIMTDNYQGVYMAIKHLVQVGKASSIGFIGDINVAISYHERWMAFQNIMNKFGINLDMDRCKIDGFENFPENPQNDIEKFIGNIKKLPDAFFCVSDMSTVALSNIIIKKGLAIPEDISVVGFDDTKLAQFNIPALTMVHIFKEYYGKRAIEQLMLNMENRNKPGEVIRIKTELVVRKSVRNNN